MTSNSWLRSRVVVAWLVLSAATVAAAADYKVVVNSANPVASLARREVSAFFLKRASNWPDGTAAQPVDGPDAPAREAFSKDMHGKKASAVRSYWLQMIFSGRGVPPPEKPSDQEVIAYVRDHAGAIGYVSGATATEAVKVLRIAP